MKSVSRLDQWKRMIEFYEDLIDNYGWSIQCMKELVEELIKHDISNYCFPSSSHASLGISTEDRYEYRLEKPMVYILCDKTRDNFSVDFQRGQGNTTHTKKYAISDKDEMFASIKDWLQNV